MAGFPSEGYVHLIKVTESKLDSSDVSNKGMAILTVKVSADCYNVLRKINAEDIKRIVVRFNHNWDNTVRYMQSFNEKDSTFTVLGKPMKTWNKITAKSLYRLDNIPDQHLARQWTWDEKNIYYRPGKSDQIGRFKVFLPVLEKMLLVNQQLKGNGQVTGVTFKNILFAYSAYRLQEDGFEPRQAAANVPAMIELQNANDIQFLN